MTLVSVQDLTAVVVRNKQSRKFFICCIDHSRFFITAFGKYAIFFIGSLKI